MSPKSVAEGFYDNNALTEEHRLDDARLEFEVTKRAISSCIALLGIPRADIVDIGGGPGRYAISLAKQGNRVTLNDLSENSLAIAKANAQAASVALEAVIHANALDITLHVTPSSFDIVLCLGPLYHLTNSEDRARVVKNAIMVAKPGSYLVLAHVTIFAHLRDLARRDPSRLVKKWFFYEIYLQSGIYDRRPDNETFHMYPWNVETELEVVKQEAEIVKMVSCESFLGFETAIALAKVTDQEMDKWVDVVMQSAGHPHTLNSAEHLIVIMRKL